MKNLKVIVTTLMIGISVIGMSASFSFRKNRNKNIEGVKICYRIFMEL